MTTNDTTHLLVRLALGVENSAWLVLYTASWLARRRGRHVRGALLGEVGYGVVNVGGFFGGHLTEARKVGSRHPAIAQA